MRFNKLSYEEKEKLFDRCNELFWYQDGRLIWKKHRGKKTKVLGEPKPWDKKRWISIDGIQYPLVKIIYLMNTRIFPNEMVHFKDLNHDNTRFENLIVYPPSPNYLEEGE